MTELKNVLTIRELLDRAPEKHNDRTFIKYIRDGAVMEKTFGEVRRDSLAFCRKLREEQNLTIFLTTHYMEETAEADRVVILDKGQVIATGSPSELKSRYTSPKLVWYAEQNEARNGLLDGCRWTYEADHYNVYYTDSVTDFLYRNRAEIRDYEVIKGSMDDVFLNLTGREMAV